MPHLQRRLAAWMPQSSRIAFDMPVAAGLFGGALLAGWACANEPRLVLLVAGGALFSYCIFRPSLAMAGLFVAGLGSEWLYEANRTGLTGLPPRAGSVVTWAFILFAAAGVLWWKNRKREQLTLIHAAVATYAFGIAFAVVVGAVRGVNISAGLEALILASIPVTLAACLKSRSATFGLRLVACYVLLQAVYCIFQLGDLQFATGSPSFFLVGNESRWWDSQALWGTFATSGNHAFANTLALCLSITLPWALYGSRGYLRGTLTAASSIALILILMSLARAAALSAVTVLVLSLLIYNRRGRFVPLIILAAGILVATQSSQFQSLSGRARVDQSTHERVTIYQSITAAPPSSYLVGQGASSAPEFTSRLTSVTAPGKIRTGPATENLFLRNLVEGGVIGALCVVAFFGLLLREGLRGGSDPVLRLWRVSLLTFTIALIVQSLVSDTIIFPQGGAMAFFLLGVIAAGLTSSHPRANPGVAEDKSATQQLGRGTL